VEDDVRMRVMEIDDGGFLTRDFWFWLALTIFKLSIY